MVVGILGAGRMGRTLARLLAGAGHEVRLANSRGPASLADVVAELGEHASAVERAEIASGADVVILATRWEQIPAAVEGLAWEGTVLVDTTNPRFGPGPGDVFDIGERTSSEVVADLAPGARVVKAFNHQPIPALAESLGARPSERNALFVAGDDAAAKALVADLMRSIGGEPIDTGGLRRRAPAGERRRTAGRARAAPDAGRGKGVDRGRGVRRILPAWRRESVSPRVRRSV